MIYLSIYISYYLVPPPAVVRGCCAGSALQGRYIPGIMRERVIYGSHPAVWRAKIIQGSGIYRSISLESSEKSTGNHGVGMTRT